MKEMLYYNEVRCWSIPHFIYNISFIQGKFIGLVLWVIYFPYSFYLQG